MSIPTLYLWFPGNAREALTFYGETFGGDVQLHTYSEFSRTDGPEDAIAHGEVGAPVPLFGADAAGDERTIEMHGVAVSLLGTSDGATMTGWFDKLSDGGTVVDPLQKRPWGDTDGTVVDRYGVKWLIGFQD